MKKHTVLLATLTIILLGLINPITAQETLTAENNTGTILIVELPYKQPEDPVVANHTIDAISIINALNYANQIELYMIPSNITINGEQVYAGSLLVVAGTDEISNLTSILDDLGIGYLVLNEKPVFPLYRLKPPKIAFLDVGDTYTVHEVLREMGFNYTILSASDIINGALVNNGYDLLILPPGSGTGEASELGSDGAVKVAEFLVDGGGLIGVCAGAYAVIKGYNDPTTQIQLVDATLKNWPTWWLGVGIVHVKVTSTNPVVYGFKDGFNAIYWNGPILVPYDLGENTTLGIDVPPYDELVRYVSTSHEDGAFSYGWGDLNQSYVDSVMSNGSAVTFSWYGKGKIVLFSFHPELLSGDLSYAPNSILDSKYNWRLWFNAIYYVSKSFELTTLNPIHGAWMWPSTFKYIFLDIYYNYPDVDLDESIKIASELLAEELESYGITDLFIEVKSTTGYIFYPGSNYLPPYPAWPYNTVNFYPTLISTLHKHGIRVHAWIPVFYDRYVWGPKDPVYHVGKSASNWEPFPVTKYVRPGNTTYIYLLANLTHELLDMGFDGIHLDYIRYGHMVYSFAPKDIERASERGINVSKVIDAVRRTFYTDYPGGYDPTYIWRLYLAGDPDIVAWFDMRRQDIDRAITIIADAVRGYGDVNGHEPILSAALMSDITINRTINNFTIPGWEFQLLHYGQMWDDFASHGYWLIPMAYYGSYGQPVEWVLNVSRYASALALEYGTVAAIGVQAWSTNLTMIELEEQYAFQGGASGYVYFRWRSYRDIYRLETWDTYQETYQELYSDLPKTILLASSYLSNDTLGTLLHYNYMLDVLMEGNLYPEPAAYSSIIQSYINNVLDDISTQMINTINSIKEIAGQLGETNITQNTVYVVKLLERSTTSSDINYKLNIIETANTYLATILVKITTILKTRTDQLLEETNTIKHALDLHESNITSIQYKLSDLSSQVNELYSIADRLEDTINNWYTALNWKTGLLGRDLETVKKNLLAINRTLVELKTKTSSLETVSEKLGSDIDTIRSTISSLSAKISDLENMKPEINTISGRLDQLEQTLYQKTNEAAGSAETSLYIAAMALLVGLLAIILLPFTKKL